MDQGPSGPSGKFCNAQPRHKHCGQGAVRREWQALSKGCNTAHDACGAALREPLREVDQCIGLLDRLGGCFTDYRNPEAVEHSVSALVAQCVYGLALGYEDLNDHDVLRKDSVLALLVGKTT